LVGVIGPFLGFFSEFLVFVLLVATGGRGKVATTIATTTCRFFIWFGFFRIRVVWGWKLFCFVSS
jgi:hypothetical protein